MSPVFTCVQLTKSASPKIYPDLLNRLSSFQPLLFFFFLMEKKKPSLINSFLPLPPSSEWNFPPTVTRC